MAQGFLPVFFQKQGNNTWSIHALTAFEGDKFRIGMGGGSDTINAPFSCIIHRFSMLKMKKEQLFTPHLRRKE